MSEDQAGRFTLDALEAAGGNVPTWPADRFGAPWNGWATPVVQRGVLAAVLEVVAAESGEPHRWEGDVAVIAGPGYEDRLEPDGAGLYDLGELGWTWVQVS